MSGISLMHSSSGKQGGASSPWPTGVRLLCVSLFVAILARLAHRLVPAALFATGKSLHPTEDLKKGGEGFFRIQW